MLKKVLLRLIKLPYCSLKGTITSSRLKFTHRFSFWLYSFSWRPYMRRWLHAEVRRGISLFSEEARHPFWLQMDGKGFVYKQDIKCNYASRLVDRQVWSLTEGRKCWLSWLSAVQTKCRCCSISIIKWWTYDIDILTLSESCVIFDKQYGWFLISEEIKELLVADCLDPTVLTLCFTERVSPPKSLL